MYARWTKVEQDSKHPMGLGCCSLVMSPRHISNPVSMDTACPAHFIHVTHLYWHQGWVVLYPHVCDRQYAPVQCVPAMSQAPRGTMGVWIVWTPVPVPMYSGAIHGHGTA